MQISLLFRIPLAVATTSHNSRPCERVIRVGQYSQRLEVSASYTRILLLHRVAGLNSVGLGSLNRENSFAFRTPESCRVYRGRSTATKSGTTQLFSHPIDRRADRFSRARSFVFISPYCRRDYIVIWCKQRIKCKRKCRIIMMFRIITEEELTLITAR